MSVQDQLQSLRTALVVDEKGQLLSLFDEFMQQQEFGLALHVVCDFLLEQEPASIQESTLSKIRSLHSLMELDESCLEELQKRQLH